MIVRRKYRLAPNTFVQMLAHRPRNTHPVPRTRPAADFIEEHQTALRGRVENGTRLTHLHHERRLTTHQIVTRPHAREHAIRHAHRRAPRRHITTHLRHQHNQSNLSQYGTFSGHIRTGQNDHPRIGRQRHVVGNELIAWHHALHHRMAAAYNLQGRPVVHHGPHIPFTRRDIRQARQRIELR